MAYIILGLFGGALGGIVAGAAIANLVTWFVRNSGRVDAGKGTTFGEADQTTSLGPAMAKWKKIQAEIDLVGSLMERAGEEGDEDALRKLTSYKAMLEKKFEL